MSMHPQKLVQTSSKAVDEKYSLQKIEILIKLSMREIIEIRKSDLNLIKT